MGKIDCYCGGRYEFKTYGDSEETDGYIKRWNHNSIAKHYKSTRHLLSEGKKVDFSRVKGTREQVREKNIDHLIDKYKIEQIGIDKYVCPCNDMVIKRHTITSHCIGNYSHRIKYAEVNYINKHGRHYNKGEMDEEEFVKLYYDSLEAIDNPIVTFFTNSLKSL